MAARSRGLSARAAVALLIAIPALLAACGGSPPDLGFVEPAEPIEGGFESWKVVQIEGSTLDAQRIVPMGVEIAPDGASMMVFFQGGDPNCYTVAGVEVERHDPAIPVVTVLYGVRLGRLGCNAALASLAIRSALEPPFAP